MGLKGRATIYGPGANPTVAWTGLATNAGFDVTDGDLTDETEVDELKNGQGKLCGFYTAESRLSASINFYPISTAASSPTQAQAAGATVLPTGPCQVTLSGFPDTTTPSAQMNGKWIYVKGGKVSYSEKQAKMTLPLFRIVGMIDADLTKLLADIS